MVAVGGVRHIDVADSSKEEAARCWLGACRDERGSEPGHRCGYDQRYAPQAAQSRASTEFHTAAGATGSGLHEDLVGRANEILGNVLLMSLEGSSADLEELRITP